jgi:hypothetical protein
LLWAVPVFFGDRLSRLNVKGLLYHDLLQSPVFVFQLAELLHRMDFNLSILRQDLIKSGI